MHRNQKLKTALQIWFTNYKYYEFCLDSSRRKSRL